MAIGQIGAVGHLGLTQGKGVPWWALAAHVVDGVRPGFSADVLNGRYALGGAARSLADLLTVTNASAIRTYIDQSGVMRTAAANTPRLDWSNGVRELLLEGASTNLLLNSAAPSTQSVTTLATAYTISFYGTGAITRSGTSAGATTGTSAAVRTSETFVATAGALTLTISGSVTLAQLEASSVPTSYIPTTSTAVTRTADLCQLTPAAAAVLQGAAGAVAWRGVVPAAYSTQPFIGTPGGNSLLRSQATPLPSRMVMSGRSGGDGLLASNAITIPGEQGVCIGWGAAGRVAGNIGEVLVSDLPVTDSLSSFFVGGGGGLVAGQILRLRQLTGWSLPDRPSAAGVQAQARAAT